MMNRAIEMINERRWLVIVCLAAFLMASGMGLISPVLSLYAGGFGVSTALVGFFITTFAIGRLLVTIPAGRASDHWGGAGLLIAGSLIVATGAMIMALASDFLFLLVGRFLEGVGSALHTSAALLVVADHSGLEERGKLNSIFQGSIFLGLTISPILGGMLAASLGMRTTMYGYVMLAFIVALIVWLWFPANIKEGARLAGTHISQEVPLGKRTASASTGELLRDRNFILVVSAAFLIFIARSGSRDTLLPLLGQAEIGLDSASIGFIFSLIGLLNLIAIPLAGITCDTIGRKTTIMLGLMMICVSLFIISGAPTYRRLLGGAALMGMGKGFGEPATIVYVTDISQGGKHGYTLGLFLTLRDLGLFIGPLVLGYLADLYGLRLPFALNGLAFIVLIVLFGVFAQETLRNRK